MADNFSRRALYSLSGKAERERARKQWRDLDLVKMIDSVRSGRGTPRAPRPSLQKFEYALREYERGNKSGGLKSLQGTEFAGLVNDIMHYGKMDRWRGVVKKFLQSLGPAGKLIDLISKAAGGRKKHSDPDVQAALNMVQAFGYEPLPPPSQRSQLPKNERDRAVQAAQQLLEAEGAIVSWPGKKVDQAPPPIEQSRPKSGRERKTVDIQVQGQNRRFPFTHPIVTREKVPTPESSNVQWFSYDVDTWTLYIRYQYPSATGYPTHRDGPLYAYSNVPPEIFLGMMKAGSKGGFVWSHIRHRGTVSGHQYDYRLVAVTGGYVPRKATLRADGEWFEERQIRTINRSGQIKVQKSKAAMPVPSRFTRFPGGQPDRGGPNRGRPNRGR